MAAARTQIYLTQDQRERLDALIARTGKTLAQLVREAVEAYLQRAAPDADDALTGTFGSLPDLQVPGRDEWDRARRAC